MDIDDHTGSAASETSDDLRATLAAAVAEHAEPSATAPAEKSAAERARDDAGRFAAKAASSTESQPAVTPSATIEAPGTAQAATRKAPSSWKTDHHEAFLNLNPAIQDYIMERENEVKRGFDERAPKVKAAEDFERILSPHAAIMQKYGLSGVQAVERLLQAQAMLERDPSAALQQLAQQYRVPLGAQPQQPGAAQPQRHPVLDEVSRLSQTVQSLQQERQQAQQAAMQADVEKFKGESPHFDSVRPIMVNLLKSGQAETLKDAYEKAVWLDPTTRDKLIAERAAPPAARVEDEKARADQAAAEKAKRAASSVRGAPSGTPAAPSNPKASLRDDIRAAMTG